MVSVGWHRLWKPSWVLLLCALLILIVWGPVGGQDLRDQYHEVRESCKNKLGNINQRIWLEPSKVTKPVRLIPNFNKQKKVVSWAVFFSLKIPEGDMEAIWITSSLVEAEALMRLISNNQVIGFNVELYERDIEEILNDEYPLPEMEKVYSDDSGGFLKKILERKLAKSMEGLSRCDTKFIMEQLKKCKLCLIETIILRFDQTLKSKE